jgi:heme-degrading monooxygenase HmoA
MTVTVGIAATPKPPYYAVIFTSLLTDDHQGYSGMAEKMVELAARQPGFLGVESARDGLGITVSYWTDLASIKRWKSNTEHLNAQKFGHEKWYSSFSVRIAKVEHEYGKHPDE